MAPLPFRSLPRLWHPDEVRDLYETRGLPDPSLYPEAEPLLRAIEESSLSQDTQEVQLWLTHPDERVTLAVFQRDVGFLAYSKGNEPMFLDLTLARADREEVLWNPLLDLWMKRRQPQWGTGSYRFAERERFFQLPSLSARLLRLAPWVSQCRETRPLQEMLSFQSDEVAEVVASCATVWDEGMLAALASHARCLPLLAVNPHLPPALLPDLLERAREMLQAERHDERSTAGLHALVALERRGIPLPPVVGSDAVSLLLRASMNRGYGKSHTAKQVEEALSVLPLSEELLLTLWETEEQEEKRLRLLSLPQAGPALWKRALKELPAKALHRVLLRLPQAREVPEVRASLLASRDLEVVAEMCEHATAAEVAQAFPRVMNRRPDLAASLLRQERVDVSALPPESLRPLLTSGELGVREIAIRAAGRFQGEAAPRRKRGR